MFWKTLFPDYHNFLSSGVRRHIAHLPSPVLTAVHSDKLLNTCKLNQNHRNQNLNFKICNFFRFYNPTNGMVRLTNKPVPSLSQCKTAMYFNIHMSVHCKGKQIPSQAWTDHGGSRRSWYIDSLAVILKYSL
jgi:hypothetical protein